MQMERSITISLMLALGGLIVGCSEKPKASPYEFVEWIDVGGVCQEDHATLFGHYSGDLVHWRNKTTGESDRYGSVVNTDGEDPALMTDKIQHPSHYYPPFSVKFKGISAAAFQSQNFVLHGISDDTDHGGGYDATCTLAVKRRLDHLPTDDERKT